jgi:MerR family transcriptional regulator, light-induced transcriptional regulator
LYHYRRGFVKYLSNVYPQRVSGYLRIGEVARRAGVNAATLRAWERRYGLLEPERSEGGFRLYSDDDVARVRTMRDHVDRGVAAAEAARLARGDASEVAAPAADPSELAAELSRAFDDFDEVAAQSVLDRAAASLSLESALRDVVLPALSTVGSDWQDDASSIAQEHFATNVVRGRLLGIARGWDRGSGPRALLACPPGEQHDLALLAFGIALRNHGWRVTHLGADTPVATVAAAAELLAPDVVVLAATDRRRFASIADDLAELARAGRLAIGGAGADERVAAQLGAELLDTDPVTAAARVAGG